MHLRLICWKTVSGQQHAVLIEMGWWLRPWRSEKAFFSVFARLLMVHRPPQIPHARKQYISQQFV
eukprot:COSAG06_NODE_11498_length_1502_cov_1.243763_2_plen_64_part_01